MLGRVCCPFGCSWRLGSGGVGLAVAAKLYLLQDCSDAFTVLGTRSVKLCDSDAIMLHIHLVDMF